LQPLNLVVAAPDTDINAGAAAGPLQVRGKRKNAGVNRRYSEDEYLVDDADEGLNVGQKRRRTGAGMMATPVGPSGSILRESLLETADRFMEEEDFTGASQVTDAPGLACLAAVAAAIEVHGDDINSPYVRNMHALGTDMELD
jgi:hypothetical protein